MQRQLELLAVVGYMVVYDSCRFYGRQNDRDCDEHEAIYRGKLHTRLADDDSVPKGVS